MAKKLFDLNRNKPQVMAILNVTPDSFSDGGSYFVDNKVALDLCCKRVEKMLAQGASIIDVGGESTRPGAQEISFNEEMDRVLPVIEMLRNFDVVVSLDSSSPIVVSEAAKLGIGLLNDVRALQKFDSLKNIAELNIPICLMHMQGQPQSMQSLPIYNNVIDEVISFLKQRMLACIEAGITKSNLLVDPGFGFGKNLGHNMALLSGLRSFAELGLPIVVGLSRKSLITQVLGTRSMEDRLAASLALAVMSVERGAWIIRAHDIKETVDALAITSAILEIEK